MWMSQPACRVFSHIQPRVVTAHPMSKCIRNRSAQQSPPIVCTICVCFARTLCTIIRVLTRPRLALLSWLSPSTALTHCVVVPPAASVRPFRFRLCTSSPAMWPPTVIIPADVCVPNTRACCCGYASIRIIFRCARAVAVDVVLELDTILTNARMPSVSHMHPECKN